MTSLSVDVRATALNRAPARGAPTGALGGYPSIVDRATARVAPTVQPSDQKHRRSIRLKGYDYSQAGAYFVTLCTRNRECLFGEIINGDMRLNAIGRIAVDQWHAIPQRFSGVELDEFVVMPNHIHGIFVIVGAPLAGALSNAVAPPRAPARGAPTVGDIVGAYKSLCVRHGLNWIKKNEPHRILGQLWQRNYWEHIVRDEAELHRIREYIHGNPAQWELDKLYTPPDSRERFTHSNDEIREPLARYETEVWMA